MTPGSGSPGPMSPPRRTPPRRAGRPLAAGLLVLAPLCAEYITGYDTGTGLRPAPEGRRETRRGPKEGMPGWGRGPTAAQYPA
ncbi:hypothetical protein GCM10010517_73360 [Streptosporangium fragile]|uniref:Uncharacterized protein n=1 Tax=Streptosporangium fragile TaxID=46186 RepID=A0ABP6IRR9_9ACTN